MFDQATLRYHPIRMRWLFEKSSYNAIVKLHEQACEQIEAEYGHGNTLGSIHYGDSVPDERTVDDFEALEIAYAKWLQGEMSRIFDLSNVANHISALPADDTRWGAEAAIPFEDAAYIHFGKEIHGFEGFYVSFDPNEQVLDYALVNGGHCDPALNPMQAAVSFSDVVYGYIHRDDDVSQHIEDRIEEAYSERRSQVSKAIRHIISTLRFLAINYDFCYTVWPSDAPAILSRKQELTDAPFWNQTAENVLWSRGWTQVEVIPIPTENPLSDNGIENAEKRKGEFLRYARSVIAAERNAALTGFNNIRTAEKLASTMEDIFHRGAISSKSGRAWLPCPKLTDEAIDAEVKLAIATFGKSPHAPELRSRYLRVKPDRWVLQIENETMDIASISEETIAELLTAGLVGLNGIEAYPTKLMKIRHSDVLATSRSRDFGKFCWG
jgi:hypothetical protein